MRIRRVIELAPCFRVRRRAARGCSRGRGRPAPGAVGPCSTIRPRCMTATWRRDVADHREVVGDEQDREAELALELADQVEHRALDGDVERRGDLVGDDDLRAAAEGARQGDALTLAAGHLGRPVAGPRGIEVDQLEQPGDLGPPLGAGAAGRQRLGDALADRHPRVQRRVGVLEDHLQGTGPAAHRDRLAVEQDLAAVPRCEPDRGAGQRWTCRTRTPPPARRPGPTGTVRLTPSTAVLLAVADGDVVEAQLAHRHLQRRARLDDGPVLDLEGDRLAGVPAGHPATGARRSRAAGPRSGSARRRADSGRRTRSPAGRSAGSTGRPGMTASGRSRSVSMSGTAATSARV